MVSTATIAAVAACRRAPIGATRPPEEAQRDHQGDRGECEVDDRAVQPPYVEEPLVAGR